MKKSKTKKVLISILILLLFIIFLLLILTKDRQRELPYRVSGQELLNIKEKCRDLAEQKSDEWNNFGIVYQSLNSYGYSEFRGTCYAEFIRDFDGWSAIILYDTVEEKELINRNWPEEILWYRSDFEQSILGKYRILDFRQPF